MSYLATFIHRFIDWNFDCLVGVIFWLRLFVQEIVHPPRKSQFHVILTCLLNSLTLSRRVKLWQLFRGQFGNGFVWQFTNTWATNFNHKARDFGQFDGLLLISKARKSKLFFFNSSVGHFYALLSISWTKISTVFHETNRLTRFCRLCRLLSSTNFEKNPLVLSFLPPFRVFSELCLLCKWGKTTSGAI